MWHEAEKVSSKSRRGHAEGATWLWGTREGQPKQSRRKGHRRPVNLVDKYKKNVLKHFRTALNVQKNCREDPEGSHTAHSPLPGLGHVMFPWGIFVRNEPMLTHRN